MHFYPHNIADFNNSTRHLTRVERSVYRDAIEHYYDTEFVLTKDFDRLAKRLLCNSDEEKSALKDVLSEFFELTDEGYSHERCNLEIKKYRDNITAKARAGKASAAARKAKRKDNNGENLTDDEQLLNSVETKDQQNPTKQETINNKQENKGEKKKNFSPPSFDEVKGYFAEKSVSNPGAKAESFIDFYASKGWMIGKNKMKDWKAAVRNWVKRDSSSPSLRNDLQDDFGL